MNFKTYKAYVENKKKSERKRIIQAENLTEVKEFLRKKINFSNTNKIEFVDKTGKIIAYWDIKNSDFFIP